MVLTEGLYVKTEIWQNTTQTKTTYCCWLESMFTKLCLSYP